MLQNGQFAKVAIKAAGQGVRNADELKKAFLHFADGGLYLLSHIQTINDSSITNVPMHGMRCATRLDFTVMPSAFEEITEVAVDGVGIIIYHDPQNIAAVHGRAASTSATRTRRTASAATAATTPAAAPANTNPYVLPNYTRAMYEGQKTYHASHYAPMNTPTNGYTGYRIGVELETEFTDRAKWTTFVSTPRNWYFCENDSSLDNYGCEIITIPLTPDDAKSRAVWRPLCARLKDLGATSWDNSNCGLHVHIGREILGDTEAEREATLSRLLLFYNLYLNDDETATKVFGRARCYHEGRHDDSQEFRAMRLLGTADVLKNKDIAKRVGDAIKRQNNTARYYTINTTNTNTIEFRKGRGSLSVDRIQTIITFCEAVCLYVRTSDDVSALSVEGFREYIRATVPASNALYHYYDVIEADR